MKISWNCLNQLIDLKNINYLTLTEKLTLAGFETDNIKQIHKNGDVTFDISITANRHDINSLINIALEISTLTRRDLKVDTQINEHITSYFHVNKLNNLTKFTNLINFNALKLKRINLNQAYQKINRYLLAHAIIPHSNFLDIITFINFKWGQDIKVYELNHEDISTVKAKIQINKSNEQLILYHKDEPKLNWTEITQQNIKGYNTPTNILLVTFETKTRSNKSLSKQYLLNAYYEILDLISSEIKNLDHRSKQKIYTYYRQESQDYYVSCEIKKIFKILGPLKQSQTQTEPYIKNCEIISILKKLKFEVEYQGTYLKIKVPKNRKQDIQDDVDIIEEIGRIYGFDKFNDKLPNFAQNNTDTKLSDITTNIRSILRSMGLHENINYSLEKTSHKNKQGLINPLNQDQEHLRSNLIHNLIQAKLHNIYQCNDIFECFEIGRVFIKNNSNVNPTEHIHLAGILGSPNFNRTSWNKKDDQLRWFQAKGHIEELLEKLYSQIIWSPTNHNKELEPMIKSYIHPKRIIYLEYNSKTIGFFSQINNQIAHSYNIEYSTYIFEINIQELLKSINNKKNLEYKYRQYSNYPKITRDLSIKVHNNISMQYIYEQIYLIKKYNIEFLESIQILNEYYENKNSRIISLRTIYRSKHRTLVNKEIEILDNLFKKKLINAVSLKK